MDIDNVIRLRRVVLGLARRLNASSAGEGLTPAQASVLAVVVNRRSLGLAELAQIEGLNPTMLSRVISKLDSFRLVRRLRDPEDFRAARVEITPDGEHMWQRISARRAELISECVAHLPAEQATALVVALPALEILSEGLQETVRRRPQDLYSNVTLYAAIKRVSFKADSGIGSVTVVDKYPRLPVPAPHVHRGDGEDRGCVGA